MVIRVSISPQHRFINVRLTVINVQKNKRTIRVTRVPRTIEKHK